MTRLVVALLLGLWVAYGVIARPGRAWTWPMYTHSARVFAWVREHDGRPHLLTVLRLGLAPDSHDLGLPDLADALATEPQSAPVDGLIVATSGCYRFRVDAGVLIAPPTLVSRQEAIAELANVVQEAEF